MSRSGNIPLFYWSSVLFEKKPMENYGDLLSKFIVEQVSGRKVDYYNAPKKRKSFFKQKHLLAIGSIMSYATSKSYVWGSGVISRDDTFGNGKFFAVRGPKTRERVLALGFKCPEVYGDPALLLPRFYSPKVEKKFKLGIIPHYIDYVRACELFKDHSDVMVIDLISNDLEKTTVDILSCEQTLSSSLHGIIVSHAYGIPSIWIKFSDKLTGDNVKFEDYFKSVHIEPYSAETLSNKISEERIAQLFRSSTVKPDKDLLDELCDTLIISFPEEFKS